MQRVRSALPFRWLAALLLAPLLSLLLSPARAEDTMQRLKERGTITLGVRESSGVLSYLADGSHYVGYHVAICEAAVHDIERAIGRELDIAYQPVTSQNRIPLVKNGTVDLECGSTTNNAGRQREVAFANTTFVEEGRILVRADSPIRSVADLDGRTVATTTGTTSVQTLRQNRRAKNVAFNVLNGKDHADSFLLLETGRADAFVMDGSLLAGLVARSKNPAAFKIVGAPLSVEPIAIMLRKDDPALKASVDATIARLAASGELQKLYDRWFVEPTPPNGVRMNLPMSAALKAALAAPNNRPTEAYAATATVEPARGPWDWQFFLQDTGEGRSYLQWLLAAWGWTLAVSLLALVLALVLGTAVGVARTAPRRGLAWAGHAWTELFRNVPLLVQIFLWYHVVPALVPPLRAVPGFVLAIGALGLFTSARISEQVRAGIESLPRGQRSASLALGMTLAQTYRHVLLPSALRVVLGPLTSEAMNIVKNSSVAFAVGVAELTMYAMQVQEETARGVQVYLVVTALYFVTAFSVGRVFAWVDRRIAVPGAFGAAR